KRSDGTARKLSTARWNRRLSRPASGGTRRAVDSFRAVPSDRFVAALNEQIANEFAAAQQYIAIGVDYDAQTLPRLAAFFYAQSLEERNHALMMVRYLLDVDARVEVPGIEAPQHD